MIILHIPHSSQHIPEEIRDQFLLSDRELKEENRRIVDHFTDELFNNKNLFKIVSPVSRLVCDVERFKDDEKEPMSKIGMGMIYTMALDGTKLRREMTDFEKDSIVEKYYDYPQSLMNRKVEEYLINKNKTLIIDCHSFPSEPFPYEEVIISPRPDICIGTDSFHTPEKLQIFVFEYFSKLGYSVSINHPFQGCYVPNGYYQKNEKVESIMIELNRSLYMDEGTCTKNNQFPKLKMEIDKLLEKIQSNLEY